MPVSIYTKNPEDDVDYNPNVMDITSPLEIYLQEIKNILNGEEASVMGALDMTVDLEGYIYEMDVDEFQIQDKIMSSLMKYSQFYYLFDTTLSVKFFKGEVRDICIIDISINKIPRLEFIIK